MKNKAKNNQIIQQSPASQSTVSISSSKPKKSKYMNHAKPLKIKPSILLPWILLSGA